MLFVGSLSFGQVVISQFYGAGGNTGATLNRDYVELFNQGTSAVDISTWSIQYNSATGTSAWLVNPLPAGASILPKKYYLIAFGAAGTNGVAISVTPDFDYTGTAPAPLNLSGSNGRLALVNVATSQPAGCISAGQLVDLVGYGTGNCFEGAAMVALTPTTAGFRANNGCTDTANNSTDFFVALPSPRNSSSPINNCVLSTSQNQISGLNVYPNPVTNGKLSITSDSNESKAVVIYDVLGKQVLSTVVTNQVVNVSDLTSGVYIVKITEEGKTATRKLVIR